MRSLIIIEVEHGEDTDTLDDILWSLSLTGNIGGMPNGVLNYTVRVDLPSCFELEPAKPKCGPRDASGYCANHGYNTCH